MVQRLDVETKAGALVRQRRRGEPVAHHDAAAGEAGAEALGDVLGARREHEQRLHARLQSRQGLLAEHERPQPFAQIGAAGLASQQHVQASALQAIGQHPCLGGFSAALGPFEGNEQPAPLAVDAHVRGCVRASRSRCAGPLGPDASGRGWDDASPLAAAPASTISVRHDSICKTVLLRST